jgi:2-phosphosulfolactate phosphatase
MAHPRRAVVIVDTLSFSTAVVAGVGAGATVYPSPHADGAAALAAAVGAVVAVHRDAVDADHPFSLSPATLAAVAPGSKIVLPSPNGSALSAAAAGDFSVVVAGALRNAAAAAGRVADEPAIAVIAAGERTASGSLRAAHEDLVGAGAVIAALPGHVIRYPGAARAELAFRAASSGLAGVLRATESGEELADRGWEGDVAFAAELDAEAVAPVLTEGAYRA